MRRALLGAAIMTAGCAPAGSAATPLALYPASAEAHQAQLSGRLSLEGSCLYVTDAGGERWLATFPSPGTRWEEGAPAVWVGERMLRVGEVGAFAGGEAPGTLGAIQWVQPPAASCDTSRLWMVSALMDP